MKRDTANFIVGVIALLGLIALSYLVTALASYIVFWAFDLAWSWKASVGVWVVWLMLSGAFRVNIKVRDGKL